jgi:hypothetical protein
VLFQALLEIRWTAVLTVDMNRRAATKYDSLNKAHEKKLMELWSFLMPGKQLSARKSTDWQRIGFQGTDPATDFRGMGVLGMNMMRI